MNAILITEEYWANSQLSVARYYGGIRFNGVEYIIVNKEGKDVLECSYEAHKTGREKAIEPGEPADLIMKDFQKLYKKLGRDKFISVLKENESKSIKEIKQIMNKL